MVMMTIAAIQVIMADVPNIVNAMIMTNVANMTKIINTAKVTIMVKVMIMVMITLEGIMNQGTVIINTLDMRVNQDKQAMIIKIRVLQQNSPMVHLTNSTGIAPLRIIPIRHPHTNL